MSAKSDLNNVESGIRTVRDLPIFNKKYFSVRALLVGDRIDLRALDVADRLDTAPMTLAVSGGGIAVLFRYGAVILFDVAPIEQADFLNHLRHMIVQAYDEPEAEEVQVHIDPKAREGMAGDTVYLRDAALERLQIVADVLGKSVVLAHYESKLRESFDRIEPFAADLERKGRVGRRAKQLLRHIGGALISEHNMVGRVEVTEKPELLWERPDLERLYLRLEDEFEIDDRHLALERKLELISRTAQTVLELLQNRRTLRVEWYIVILIFVEIILTLYESYFRI